MSVYADGKRIGQSSYSVNRKGALTEVTEKTRLRIKLLDRVQDIGTEARYKLDGMDIKSFEFVFDSPSGEMRAEGVRQGGSFNVRTKTVSGENGLTFPADGSPIPAPLLPEWILAQKPEAGAEYRVMVMDPLSVISGSPPEDLMTTHRIEAREEVDVPFLGRFECWKVVSTVSASEVTSWITDGGEVVKQIMPPGLTAYLEAGDGSPGGFEVFDITGVTSIPSGVKLADPRAVRHLKAELSGLSPEDGFHISDGYRQSYEGDIIVVRADALSPADSYALPYRAADYAGYLADSPLIQSSDPKIRSKSSEITGREKDSLKAASLINAWVFKSLEKTGTASIPSALDVLETLSGDCNEHSALFAALSRSAGIPTKTVSGTIYIDGRFYYHAWNEVFVGRWVAVDPTFGQMPADATHIKLIEGDLGESARIMKAVGKINIKILEAS